MFVKKRGHCIARKPISKCQKYKIQWNRKNPVWVFIKYSCMNSVDAIKIYSDIMSRDFVEFHQLNRKKWEAIYSTFCVCAMNGERNSSHYERNEKCKRSQLNWYALLIKLIYSPKKSQFALAICIQIYSGPDEVPKWLVASMCNQKNPK